MGILKVNNHRVTAKFIIFMAALLFATGCATITETAKGFLGISTKVLEDGRKEAIKRTVNSNVDTCFALVEKTLKEKGAYIYAKDTKKKMIAVYISAENTTPVGVFFKELNATNTQIEISSPSKFGKEAIAEKVFSAFEEKSTEKGS